MIAINRVLTFSCAFLAVVILIACVPTDGPVVVRDVGAPEVVKAPASENNTTEKSVEPNISAPLKVQLLDQANEEYRQEKIQNAISLAERGLRIDRQEPGFYKVLSQSYLKLGNKNQSQNFARQGLRYARKGTSIYQDLLSLSR